ncbi:MAG: type I-C CRISPR-associated protein Cas8c/Csd1 [Isosphaeraceae bacterium]
MILTRLYELANRASLLEDPAFERLPVLFIIELDDAGRPCGEGISERRVEAPPTAKGGGKAKATPGRPMAIPRPHGNTATQGFARCFADSISRVLPLSFDLANEGERERTDELAKRGRSRETFWSQISRAADETDDPALRAVQAFGRRLAEDTEMAARLEGELKSRGAKATDRCTFAFAPDMGQTILERDAVKQWYRSFYRQYTSGKQQSGPTGFCQITGHEGPIPVSHPLKINLPGGMSVGTALVSYDKAAFESYGLEGTANASVGYEAADGYGLAINALLKHELPRVPRSSMRVGDTVFAFWTREPEPLDFIAQFEAPTAESVEKLLQSAGMGSPSAADADVNDFYCLVLSANAARAVVRGYLEAKLPEVKESAARWFRDLKIASTRRDDHGFPIAAFSLSRLAASMTAPKAGNQPDWQRVNDLVPQLMMAALRGDALPDGVLASCLQRLRVEGGPGFQPARMALIKLCLIRKGVSVSERLNPLENDRAYVCGRLLALFEQIQRAALPSVKATVVDRYYGGFSSAPMTALGELFNKAQHHLSSLRSTNERHAGGLEKQLALVASKLTDVPEGQLSFADQARFALGYYHAKAERIERAARHQQERAEAEARKRATKANEPSTSVKD